MESAECLITEGHSLDALTFDLIAERAGVSRVSLYHFFDSVESLLSVLYARGAEKMMASITDIPDSGSWRKIMTALLDKSMDFYRRHPVEMTLGLSPISLPTVMGLNQSIGRDVHTLLIQRAQVSGSVTVGRACEIAVDIADAVWRKSYVEKGTITPTYHKQAKLAVLSYLANVLDAE